MTRRSPAWLLAALLALPATAEQFGAYQRTLDAHGPAALARTATGELCVLEQDRHRVRVLDSDGQVVRTFGSFGDGDGQLQRPAALAVADDGEVLVADAGNQRIARFAADGTWLGAWGTFGSGPGELHEPRGIAVHDGRVYVADAGNHRVQVFDREGTPLATFGGYGTAEGRFIRPVAVVIADDGSVFVVEEGNARVQRFAPDGRRLGGWGGWGFFPGLFAAPRALAIHDEQVFVVDQGNHRIQVFSLDGTFRYEFGLHALKPRQGEGHLHYPDAIVFAADGQTVMIGEFFEDRVQEFGLETPEQAERRRRIYRPVLSAAAPHFGPRCDAEAELLAVSTPDAQQVLIYDLRPAEPVLVHSFGRQGTAAGQFLAPGAVLLEPGAQRLLVADNGTRQLSAYTLAHDSGADIKHRPDFSRLARARALAGDDDAGLTATALARTPDGTLFVLDAAAAAIVRVDDDWRPVARFGGYGTGEGQLRNPTDLAATPDGRLVVVDAGNQRVQVFEADGTFVRAFGTFGRSPGAFRHPFGVAVANDGGIFVSDVDLHRVSSFAADGTHRKTWGGKGLGAGEFLRPRDVEIDGQGRLLVIDHGNHRIQFFDQAGTFLRAVGPRLFVLPTKTATIEED